ncbi:immunity 22 family protein [Pseudomonas sp. C5pp]|uniref:immunity 22 family protein n=1 Tax=Pseudomonas sp. C5pp TaxID=1586081 RepID=UPI0009E43620|nr:immunity 22 family protein [Pseudomonas sp. C5pp]
MNKYEIERYNKVHLWLGVNLMGEDEYFKYFEIDYSSEFEIDDPRYPACQFCLDVGERWYDEDFIGIIPRKPDLVGVDDMLGQSPIDVGEWGRVKSICTSLAIVEVNAMFWYSDGGLQIPTPLKESYNGLRYIGLFEGE